MQASQTHMAGSLNAGITNTHASHKPLNMDGSLAMSLDVVRQRWEEVMR